MTRRKMSLPPFVTVELAPGVTVRHGYRHLVELTVETPPPPPRLVSWWPRGAPPVVESECPSCGQTDERTASSWSGRRRDDDTRWLRARLACEAPGCFRIFDVALPEPAAPANAELWR